LTVFAAQHAGDRAPAWNCNTLEDTPVRCDPDKGLFVEEAHPYGLLAVHTDAVRGAEATEAPVELERAVGADVETRQAIAFVSATTSCRPSADIAMPFGKSRPSPRFAVRGPPRQE
jgi:hypothetical protein